MVRAFALYTFLRLVLFALCFGLLLLVGLDGLLAVAGALLVSSLLSLLLLREPRDRFAAALEERRVAKTAERDRLRGLLDQDDAEDRPAPGT